MELPERTGTSAAADQAVDVGFRILPMGVGIEGGFPVRPTTQTAGRSSCEAVSIKYSVNVFSGRIRRCSLDYRFAAMMSMPGNNASEFLSDYGRQRRLVFGSDEWTSTTCRDIGRMRLPSGLR